MLQAPTDESPWRRSDSTAPGTTLGWCSEVLTYLDFPMLFLSADSTSLHGFSRAGVVYNVTPYLEYHPGGVDELLRGVGRDCTPLFDEVRPLF